MAGRPQFAGLVEQPIGAGTFEEGLHAAQAPALSYDCETCETCNGTGTDPDLDEVYEGNCLECNGEGTLVDPEICADCEESTAAGTPDPHVCGGGVVP